MLFQCVQSLGNSCLSWLLANNIAAKAQPAICPMLHAQQWSRFSANSTVLQMLSVEPTTGRHRVHFRKVPSCPNTTPLRLHPLLGPLLRRSGGDAWPQGDGKHVDQHLTAVTAVTAVGIGRDRTGLFNEKESP